VISQFFAQCARGEFFLGAPDLVEAHLLGEEVRRDHNQTADAVILHTPRIDRGNRSAVAMAEQNAALKANRREYPRQNRERFLLHEVDASRQLCRARLAITGARIDEDAGAGRRRKLIWKRAPQAGGAEPFMQHRDGRCCLRPRSDHPIFQAERRQIEEALIGEAHDFSSLALPACGPSKSFTVRKSSAKLCSIDTPDVSISACARA